VKERLLFLGNLGLFALAILVLGTVQTSLWFQIFGHFPSPALWIPCLIFVALSRSTLEAVVFAYIAGFMLSTLTAMPEGILMIVCLGLVLTAQIFKQRIYWSSSSYFMMTCGFAALMFHVYHWAVSFLVGDHPLVSPAVSDWLIEALLTPLAAPLIFPLLRWFDRWTGKEQSTQVSTQVP